MSLVIVKALLFSLVPVLAAAVSGGVAVMRPPGERTTSALQHFAAGVVFAAASIELLPDVLRQSPVVAIVGFAVGIAVMFAFRGASVVAERVGNSGVKPACRLGFSARPGSTSPSTASSWARGSEPPSASVCC